MMSRIYDVELTKLDLWSVGAPVSAQSPNINEIYVQFLVMHGR